VATGGAQTLAPAGGVSTASVPHPPAAPPKPSLDIDFLSRLFGKKVGEGSGGVGGAGRAPPQGAAPPLPSAVASELPAANTDKKLAPASQSAGDAGRGVGVGAGGGDREAHSLAAQTDAAKPPTTPAPVFDGKVLRPARGLLPVASPVWLRPAAGVPRS